MLTQNDNDGPKRAEGLDAGQEAVLALLAERESDGVAVVGVTGPVASGKSTLSAKLAEQHGAIALTTDRYLPNYAELPREEHDNPNRADLDRLRADIATLRRGGSHAVPVWSFFEHRRTGEEEVGPVRALLVVEGIHALHVREYLDALVLVTAPAEVRLARWVAIAERGERGWGPEETRTFFRDVAEPTWAEHTRGVESLADLIVVNE